MPRYLSAKYKHIKQLQCSNTAMKMMKRQLTFGSGAKLQLMHKRIRDHWTSMPEEIEERIIVAKTAAGRHGKRGCLDEEDVENEKS